MGVARAIPGRVTGIGTVGIGVASDGVGEDNLADFGGEGGEEGGGELRVYVGAGGDEGDGGGLGGGAEGAAMLDVCERRASGGFVAHVVSMALDYRHGSDLIEEIHWQ